MSKTCTDHRGNKYPSKTAMAKAWGIACNVLDYRLSKRWDLKKALTTPAGGGYFVRHPCTDHLGNSYPSKAAMAQAYGLTFPQLEHRLTKGMSLERALTTPVKGHVRTVTDCFGQTFASISAAARFYGLQAETLAHKLRNGTSFAEISLQLTEGSKDANITDHRGQIFRSQKAMAEHWGIKPLMYSDRIRNGWTKEEALTIPPGGRRDGKNGKKCCDHEGHEFSSLRLMAEYWHISPKILSQRKRSGWPLKDALTLPPGAPCPLSKEERFGQTGFTQPQDTHLITAAAEHMQKTHDADELLEVYRMCLAKNPNEWEQGRINEIYSDNLARLDWENYD